MQKHPDHLRPVDPGSAAGRESGHQPGPASEPAAADVEQWTDLYFLKTKAVVEKFGDAQVTYAVFMRRPVISAPRLTIDWLKAMAAERGTEFQIDLRYAEGRWVGAGEPLMYISGSLVHLSDLETILLQKLGPACVAAFNAFTMCSDLPRVAFLAMDARHCAGLEMAEIMAYAASVGSNRARRKVSAVGFIGNATHATAHYFGQDQAMGTMPHALIGYAGSTLRAAEMFHETFPDQALYVLVDYFGREVTDVVSCPGTDSCKLGITSSMGLNAAVRERIAAMDITDPLTRRIHVKMSGCPNGCSQHHIANIGFYGASIKVGDQTIPAYIAHLGGNYEGGEVLYGHRLKARLPAKRVPDAVERCDR